MRIRMLVLAALTVFTLASCSNVKDMKFTETNREEVISKVLTSGDLTDQERLALTVAIGKAQASGQSMAGKTVGEILNEAQAAPKP